MPGPAGHQAPPARIGVLSIQGGFQAHCEAVTELGAAAVEVRGPADLADLNGLIIPGGESTTIAMGVASDGLGEAIAGWVREGGPVLATCAGMILLGRDHLGLLGMSTRRNAFGRQLASFEADLPIPALGDPAFPAVFIRAPWAEDVEPGVEVLAELHGHPVAVEQGLITAVSFHPELTGDRRLHERLLDRAG